MNKLSVVIITFNEEKNIARCLESVLPIADEIIVVDSLSTDKTEEICQKFNVRFVSQPWLGFSEQKNFANHLAIYDWIFSIDADEVLSPTLQQSINGIKQIELQDNQVFSMNRLTNYCGKWIRHCGWYPDDRIRIWNKNLGKWEGSIHETIIFSKKMNEIRLKGDLFHYSYKDIADHLFRVNQYTSLIANEYQKRGKKASFFKIIFSPFFTFFWNWVIRGGFLDGKQGWIVCKISAFTTFSKYIKLWEIQKGK